jgi:hypothetical protein
VRGGLWNLSGEFLEVCDLLHETFAGLCVKAEKLLQLASEALEIIGRRPLAGGKGIDRRPKKLHGVSAHVIELKSLRIDEFPTRCPLRAPHLDEPCKL